MSDIFSDDYSSHENSYNYGSNFQSNNAAYIVRNINVDSNAPGSAPLPRNCKFSLSLP
jgi:hypothetical protein